MTCYAHKTMCSCERCCPDRKRIGDDPTPAPFLNPLRMKRVERARYAAQLRELDAIRERCMEVQDEHLNYIGGQSMIDADFRDPAPVYVERITTFLHEQEQLAAIYARKANGLRAVGAIT